MNHVKQDMDTLTKYFAGRLGQHVDQLWQEQGLTSDDMERWLISADHWMVMVTGFEIVGDYTIRNWPEYKDEPAVRAQQWELVLV
jgi:hypothetical protein